MGINVRQQHNRHIEFFAGVGGVRIGLMSNWETIWANDIDPIKRDIYIANAANAKYVVNDIGRLQSKDIPLAELASATFPCSNTSCAGKRAGLLGIKSGVVYRFLKILDEKGGSETVPVSLLENPVGLIARNQGSD
jgi:DNA (cytosine-5)-methyltransferase 1